MKKSAAILAILLASNNQQTVQGQQIITLDLGLKQMNKPLINPIEIQKL
jgi:hypothetical protein